MTDSNKFTPNSSPAPADTSEPAERLLQLWERGEVVELESFLSATPTTPTQFCDVLQIDQHHCWQRGERVSAENYFDRFPQLRDDPECAVDLIFHEFLLRERMGESPTADEFANRFPAHAVLISKQIELHRAIDMSPSSSQIDSVTQTVELPHRAEPGAMIGPYKLLEQIGEGGMGIVYMADQQSPVHRRVALKIIKPGMDTRQVIARFEAERQALAMMDHPNIAKVLDAGATPSGGPYFVMELVRGIPITDYCDQNNLSVTDRLKLFVNVCQAVQHAHQKGVIHRDLKPTNVMVTLHDGHPVPKVIDFGLAKAINQQLTERTLFTNFAQMVGTPLYMSPEQAEMSGLGVDTRSDVYSLGVLLYELLTGTTPFDRQRLRSAAYEEIRRIIREEEPPRPSTRISSLGNTRTSMAAHRRIDPDRLSKMLRGDLDWVVMKTLEKDRTRRYETANGLARDIERFLADQPVEACPPSAVYRFRKFARRNRLALATGALVAATLVMGVVGSTWQAIRAIRAERLAESRLVAETKARTDADLARTAESEQRRLAEAERATAEANYQKARQAVDEYFTQISEKQLLDVPGLQSLRKDLLDSALRFYQNSADERSSDPAVLADLAVTYIRVAIVNQTLDRNDDGIAAVTKAREVLDRLRHDFPDAHDELRSLAGFWKGFRPSTPTTELPQDRLGAFQAITRLIKTWESLAQQFPEEISFRSDLAAIYHLTGDLLASGGRREDGVGYFTKAKEILLTLVRDLPDNPGYRADLARTHEQLARNLPLAGRPDGAEAECRAALALREKLVEEFPNSPLYRQDLSVSLRQTIPFAQTRNAAEAEQHTRRQIELCESLVRDYPDVSLYQVGLMEAQKAQLLSKVATAEKDEIDEVLRLTERWVAECPPDVTARIAVAHLLRSLALAIPARYQTEELNLFQRSHYIFQSLVDEHPDNTRHREDLGHSGRYLGGRLQNAGDAEGARQSFQTAADAFEKLTQSEIDQRDGFYREFLADTIVQTGQVWRSQGNEAEAIEAFNRSVNIRTELVEEYPNKIEYREKLGGVLWQLAMALKSQEDQTEAQKVLDRCVKLRQELVAQHPKNSNYRYWYAETMLELERYEDANETLQAALELDPGNVVVQYWIAVLRLGADDRAGYRQTCERMCQQFGEAADPGTRYWLAWTCGLAPDALDDMSAPLASAQRIVDAEPNNPSYLATLGLILYRCGRFDEAAERLKQSNAKLPDQVNRVLTPLYPQLLLAMTHRQLGHAEEAQHCMGEVRAGIEKEPLATMPWNRRITVQLWQRETEQLGIQTQ